MGYRKRGYSPSNFLTVQIFVNPITVFSVPLVSRSSINDHNLAMRRLLAWLAFSVHLTRIVLPHLGSSNLEC